MTYLDSEHVLLITNIDYSTYFRMLDMYVGLRASEPIRSTDLTFLANPLFRYYQLTRQLQQYADRHLTGLAWSAPRD
jgi:hypothetical protein